MRIALQTQSDETEEAFRRPISLHAESTEEAYLAREFDGLVEFSEGVLEFLPIPTWLHQLLVDYLHSRLKTFVRTRALGMTAFAPLRIRIGPQTYCEPDVLYITPGRFRGFDKPSDGADLVMEVVSDTKEDRQRDIVEKRADYAAAGIPEYWIVDPVTETITVLVLDETKYREHGVFKSGNTATSKLLPGFEINVKDCFDVGKVDH